MNRLLDLFAPEIREAWPAASSHLEGHRLLGIERVEATGRRTVRFPSVFFIVAYVAPILGAKGVGVVFFLGADPR